MRLQKFIASTGLLSRRAAERAIEEGRVAVNGKLVREHGIQVEVGSDEVALDGLLITPPPKKRVVIFHKPDNVVSTMSDPQGRASLHTVLPDECQGLFPVGRLDRHTTGLLVFTNDGDLAERLLHPRYELPRVYIAVVVGAMSRLEADRALEGVMLDDGIAHADIRVVQKTQSRSKVQVQIAIGR